jgi:hypothetical protein
MTEQELRVLVRDAIAKQRGAMRLPAEAPAFARDASFGEHAQSGRIDVSYLQFGVPSGPDGSCIIEPAVMCNHCGYCKSYGH